MARVTYYYLIYNDQFCGATYEVFTYGEPRSGNKEYADFLNSQNITTARIVDRYEKNELKSLTFNFSSNSFQS